MSIYKTRLEELERMGRSRALPQPEAIASARLNLTSNDYLGIATDTNLRKQFLETLTHETLLGSTSSRLLTGNSQAANQLEATISTLYANACLLANSGYHANIGILPALANKNSLILMDKLAHASLIDGARLSEARLLRFRHNDMQHLSQLLEQNHAQYEQVFIVVESLYSMDGDFCDLRALADLKRTYSNVSLYVDEAHAVGIYGDRGLGYCEQCGVLGDIDVLVGTFGKAFGSYGAYIICSQELKRFLVNSMRSLIFTTALPPITYAWSDFVVNAVSAQDWRRAKLLKAAVTLRKALSLGGNASHIIPLILGSDEAAVRLSKSLRDAGFYCLPIRPPTVPEGTSRIRFSLTADVGEDDLQHLIEFLRNEAAID